MGGWGLVKKITPWLLLAVLALYIITGFGITHFRTIETITFGLLTKNLSFKIHNALTIPFAVLLVVHIVLPYVLKKKNKGGS
jgi:cytochrome b subunit of formate dehydrogenase